MWPRATVGQLNSESGLTEWALGKIVAATFEQFQIPSRPRQERGAGKSAEQILPENDRILLRKGQSLLLDLRQ